MGCKVTGKVDDDIGKQPLTAGQLFIYLAQAIFDWQLHSYPPVPTRLAGGLNPDYAILTSLHRQCCDQGTVKTQKRSAPAPAGVFLTVPARPTLHLDVRKARTTGCIARACTPKTLCM
jgi:hypothetical protein